MESFAMTDIGIKRQSNQDYIFCAENSIGSFPNLFIVADGMGGHKAGDYASKTCVDCVVDSIKKTEKKTTVSILEEAIHNANKQVLADAKASIEYEGMGTTFVSAVIMESVLYVANIGDSRLYTINEKGIKQVTQDHSLVEEMIRNGEIERKESRLHPNKNIITRALGTNEEVTADYFEVELKKDDIVLLCSDGLSNMMEDEDIMYVIRRYSQISIAGSKLIEKANACGGKDNISIILIRI
ncbi:MAG: Stp1/IreP family PP2C-type Ser/Thr phosphatase [Velocimicrobium sp.]